MANSTQDLLTWMSDTISERLAVIDENIPGGRLAFVALCAVTYFSVRYLKSCYVVSKTKKKIACRQAKTKARLQKIRDRVENAKNIDMNITKLSFKELQTKLLKGELKAREVILAYQKKALEVNDVINCVTDFVTEAEEWAMELDKVRPDQRGPLHGIPFSMKETVGLKGYDSTAGFGCFIDQDYPEDAILMKVLKAQGAIPFAFTNLSQGEVGLTCSNPIFGETFHPLDQKRSCGGSTGGEGAIIGGGASIVGIGCDAGGSNRIPSHFCGICGLKPTPRRTSGRGNSPVGAGMTVGEEVYGPVGRDVDSLVETMKAALCPLMWELDPLLPKIPWREELYSSTKPLRIGYYTFDGGMDTTPAVKRCVLEAKEVLQRRGHQLVEFDPPDVQKAISQIFIRCGFADEGRNLQNNLAGDVVDKTVAPMQFLMTIPKPLRKLLPMLMTSLHPVEKNFMGVSPPASIYEWWNLMTEVEDYRHEFVKAWKSLGLDALLCPVFNIPAFQNGNDSGGSNSLSLTALFNLLDFPAASYPFGKVEQKDIDAMKDYPSQYSAEKYIHSVYKDAQGMPIGVQCVSLPFQEEIVLRMMKELEKGQHK